MDIHIEAPGHKNFAQLDAFYRDKLENRYKAFEFVKSIEAKVTSDKSGTTVKMNAILERDPYAFVQASHMNEDRAFKDAIQKLDHVIRKYKSKHYHGI